MIDPRRDCLNDAKLIPWNSLTLGCVGDIFWTLRFCFQTNW